MPIVISANADLALQVVEFTGRVRFSELTALAQTHTVNRAWAGADTIHVVADDADLSLLTDDDLEVLRARYRKLHQSIDFFVLRRSGWACATSEAYRILNTGCAIGIHAMARALKSTSRQLWTVLVNFSPPRNYRP